MLKLLSITLSRSSTLLSGDNYNILPEVLERLLPLLACADLAELHAEAGAVVCRILSLVHATAPALLGALARGTQTLVEGARSVAEAGMARGDSQGGGARHAWLSQAVGARGVSCPAHCHSPTPLQTCMMWRVC